MRVFVSGATGVVGRRVIPLLLAQGHMVTAAVREMPASWTAARFSLKYAKVDLFDADDVRQAVAGHDVVINLATSMPSAAWKMVFRRAWRMNDRIRTEGAANIAAAAVEGGAKRLIQESFAPAYPDRGEDWIDEETPLEPARYNRTVCDAEEAAAGFSGAERAGLVLRFAAFYGPDAMQLHSYIDALRRGWAALPGAPDSYISSISHDDAATAVVAALHAPAGAYNVADDEPVTRATYFASLARALELQPPRFLPGWTMPLFGAVGPTMARSQRISNRSLKQATGWTPRFPSVREGWPATLAMMGGR